MDLARAKSRLGKCEDESQGCRGRWRLHRFTLLIGESGGGKSLGGKTCETLLIGERSRGKPQLPADRLLIGKRDWGNCELLLIEVLLGCAYWHFIFSVITIKNRQSIDDWTKQVRLSLPPKPLEERSLLIQPGAYYLFSRFAFFASPICFRWVAPLLLFPVVYFC